MENKINKFLEELIQEVEKDLDEATTSGAAGAYSTPNAFSDNGSKDKKKKKKIATQLGMKLVGKVNEGKYNYKADALTAYFKGKLTPQELDTIARDDFKSGIATKKELSSFLSNKFTQDVMSDTYGIPTGTLVKKVRGLMKFAEGVSESVITEKQFKGLDGIDDKTSLTKISDTQKLKIIQGTGNIISFKVPKGSDRNFWQVISKGKIKKTRNPQGYTRYILPGKMISSPFFKSEKDLVNGVDWDSVEKARRFNESVVSEDSPESAHPQGSDKLTNRTVVMDMLDVISHMKFGPDYHKLSTSQKKEVHKEAIKGYLINDKPFKE